MPDDPSPDDPRATAVHNEQIKLTANYLNGVAGSLFTAGVVAPVAAFALSIAGSTGPAPLLTLALAVPIFFTASLLAHVEARRVLRSLRP